MTKNEEITTIRISKAAAKKAKIKAAQDDKTIKEFVEALIEKETSTATPTTTQDAKGK